MMHFPCRRLPMMIQHTPETSTSQCTIAQPPSWEVELSQDLPSLAPRPPRPRLLEMRKPLPGTPYRQPRHPHRLGIAAEV